MLSSNTVSFYYSYFWIIIYAVNLFDFKAAMWYYYYSWLFCLGLLTRAGITVQGSLGEKCFPMHFFISGSDIRYLCIFKCLPTSELWVWLSVEFFQISGFLSDRAVWSGWHSEVRGQSGTLGNQGGQDCSSIASGAQHGNCNSSRAFSPNPSTLCGCSVVSCCTKCAHNDSRGSSVTSAFGQCFYWHGSSWICIKTQLCFS